MKNSISIKLVSIFFPFLFFSCTKNNSNLYRNSPTIPAKQEGYATAETKSITDSSTLNLIYSYVENNVSPLYYNNNVVTFTNAYFSTSSEGSPISTYYSNSTLNDSVSFSLALIYNSDSSKILDYMYVKTTTISETHKILTYYNSSQVSQFEVEINTVTGVVEMRIATGQQVMDCVTHFYSDEGWVSLGLWVGTLFDPGIGVSVVAACAIGQTFFPSNLHPHH